MRYFFIFLISLLPMAALAELSVEAIAKMRGFDVVILGEVHDNPVHHIGQAAAISALRPKAVVFEMLTPDMARQAQAFEGGDVSKLGAAIGWAEAGWPDFTIYQPIFEALGNARIIGAAPDRDAVRLAFANGAAEVFGPQAAEFGLDRALPEAQFKVRAQLQFDVHCQAIPMEVMAGMVEAQRYRDAVFAQAALEARAAHGIPVVVITGHGHARKDWGMPDMIRRAAPDVSVFSLGFLEAPAATGDPRFDLAIVTPAAERGDPCAIFNK